MKASRRTSRYPTLLTVPALLTMLVIVTGCTAQGAECRTDADCSGDQQCIQGGGVFLSGGTCVRKTWLGSDAGTDTEPTVDTRTDTAMDADTGDTAPAIRCANDSDCPRGDRCVEDFCREGPKPRFILVANFGPTRLLPYCSSQEMQSCEEQKPEAAGADIMGVELINPDRKTIAWGTTVAAATSVKTFNDFSGVVDGEVPDWYQSSDSLCPAQISKDTVASLGCSGAVVVGFPKKDGGFHALAKSDLIRVHEYGSQCTDTCPAAESKCATTMKTDGSCAEERLGVTVCDAEAMPEDFEDGKVAAGFELCDSEVSFYGHNTVTGNPKFQ